MQRTALTDEALAPFELTRGTGDVLTSAAPRGRALQPVAAEADRPMLLLLSGAGLTSRLNKLEAQNCLGAAAGAERSSRTLLCSAHLGGRDRDRSVIPRVRCAAGVVGTARPGGAAAADGS